MASTQSMIRIAAQVEQIDKIRHPPAFQPETNAPLHVPGKNVKKICTTLTTYNSPIGTGLLSKSQRMLAKCLIPHVASAVSKQAGTVAQVGVGVTGHTACHLWMKLSLKVRLRQLLGYLYQ